MSDQFADWIATSWWGFVVVFIVAALIAGTGVWIILGIQAWDALT